MVQTDTIGAVICVIAAQVGNLCESFVGAALQGQKGYEWVQIYYLSAYPSINLSSSN
jgi:hypothetical protein